MKIFVLEDEIERLPRSAIVQALEGHEVTYAKSFDEAIGLYLGPYDLLLLDHDMEGFFENSNHPNTGYQFCRWLIDGPYDGEMLDGPKPHVVIHSHNYVGAEKMQSLLEDFGFVVEKFPFNSQYISQLKQVLSARIWR